MALANVATKEVLQLEVPRARCIIGTDGKAMVVLSADPRPGVQLLAI